MKRVAVVCALVTSASAASADDTDDGLCADHVMDPPALAWREAGVDATRPACLHADLALTLGARVILAEDDFYGSIAGGATIAVRTLESDRLEWGLSLRALDGVFVQNAVLKVTDLGYGPLGAHLALASRGRAFGVPRRSAHYLRLELPYTRSRLDGSSGAAQLGHASTWLLTGKLQFHGHVALLGWYASSTSGRDARSSLTASADVGWLAISWMTLFAGGDAQLGWYGWSSPVLAARLGLHARIKGLWRLESAVGRPLLGDDRADLHLNVGLRRDLD